nr:MAG TPA: hypothetical protein [Caudoviricetes sp.]
MPLTPFLAKSLAKIDLAVDTPWGRTYVVKICVPSLVMIFVFITPLEKTAFATFAPVLWFVLKKTSMASLKLVGFITLAKLEPIISSYVTVLMAAKCIGLLLPAFTGVSIPYQIVNKQ